MFRELDVVRLKKDDLVVGVETKHSGTIVDVLADGVFTVEFMDEHGDSIEPALYKTYAADELIKAD